MNLGGGNLADLQEEDEEQNPPDKNNKPSDEEEDKEEEDPFADEEEDEEEDYDITLGEDTPTPNKAPAFDFSGVETDEEEDFDDDTIATLKQIKMDNKSQATSRSNRTAVDPLKEGPDKDSAVYGYEPEHHYIRERHTNNGLKQGYMCVCSLPSDVFLSEVRPFIHCKRKGKKGERRFLILRWQAPIQGYNINRFTAEPREDSTLTFQEYENLVTRYRILKQMFADGLEEKGYTKPGQVVYCQVVFEIPSDGPELDPVNPFVNVQWEKTDDDVEIMDAHLDDDGLHSYPTVLAITYLECVTKKSIKAPHEQQVKRLNTTATPAKANWQKPPSNEVLLVPKKRASFTSADFQDARTAPSHYNEETPPNHKVSGDESRIIFSEFNSQSKRIAGLEKMMHEFLPSIQHQLSALTLANGHTSPKRAHATTGGENNDEMVDVKQKRPRVETNNHTNIVDDNDSYVSYQDTYEDGDMRLMSPRGQASRSKPVRMRMRGPH